MSTYQILTSHLGLPMIVAVLYISWMLRAFSQRIGDVTKMKPYYRWLDLGNVWIALSILGYIVCSNAQLSGRPTLFLGPACTLLVFHLPLALGVVVNLTVTLIYWGWLLRKL